MEEEIKQPTGWKDIQVTPDMPLGVIIGFMNVLNQRLCAIEDSMTVPYNNKMITLTELYAIQAEEERKAMEEQAKANKE